MKSVIVATLFFNLFYIETLCGQEKVLTKEDSCISYIMTYSSFWKKDKFGKNGFRQLMADLVLSKFEFKGRKWNEFKKYFGEPNQNFKLEGFLYYRYRLNYIAESIKEVGTNLFDIEVDTNGVIVGVSISMVDG